MKIDSVKSYEKNELAWILEQVAGLTDTKKTLSVSDNAEAERILPKGSPFPGPYRNERTPYLIEPMNSCSDSSDVEFEIWLKGHQLGFTLCVENIIQYIIKNAPGPILYTTASDQLGREWSENRFDPMIQQSGMQNLIFSQTIKKGNKKTGDKTLLKEFPGGRIKIAGYGSTAAFRSSSYQYFFGDEIDEASADLKNQGNTLDQAEGRTSAYKSKRKIVLFSTPIEEEQSNINKAYLLGDQRKYFVPCPHCGFMQELDFYKLVYERDDEGILIVDSVKHSCANEDCSIKYFYNYHKAGMYSSGNCEWRATAKSKRANYISRQISCLYSPAGMISWSDVVQKYIDALDSGEDGKMKAFETLYLGLPYKEKGEAPEYNQVVAHRGSYLSKSIPDGVMYLTLGADVQGDRIELEILGHGRKYRTWSIDYQVIPGSTEVASAGAFALFTEMFLDGQFVYDSYRGKFAPQMGLIDSGYRGDIVTAFCETCPGLYPSIGRDKFAAVHKRFDVKELPGSKMMHVTLATNPYKDRVYSSLRVDHPGGAELPPNYPSFPADYDDKYFKMLNAEYKRKKRTGGVVSYEYHCPSGRRNEALDCRVYNLCASEVIYFLTIKNVLQPEIDKLEAKMGRKLIVKEKLDIFYSHMERYAVL